MTEADKPQFLAADHVSFTVEELEPAIAFYCDVMGASELFRMGPLDAAEMPKDDAGRDWTDTHIGVAGACITLVMLKLTDNLNLQLITYDKPHDKSTVRPRHCDAGGHHLGLKVDDVEKAARYLSAHGCEVQEIIAIDAGPLAGKKNLYIRDPFGNPIEIVD
ncbi:VOC family protein [Altericroceibacterium endophyticum]|uniref:VOC family protein n=1 Tax=Altericroceibacterium endophyticum TaxID=1808508 RepID=A0A6I4T9F9_9SPHN|nr:VOC family protein [Altericroceibacterium endophyticum]MXO67039.1 VOC family protein [Altericroceibacterium endophyticum]